MDTTDQLTQIRQQQRGAEEAALDLLVEESQQELEDRLDAADNDPTINIQRD